MQAHSGSTMSAREITQALGGKWHGRYGLCPGPGHSPHDRSLKLSDGPNGLMVHSFAGERWQDIKDALRSQGLLPSSDRNISRQSWTLPAAVNDGPDINRKRAFAHKIWKQAQPAAGTLVEHYLRSRGITLPLPAALRFAPELTHKPTGMRLPAMVAAVVDVQGHLVGIHRTYLGADGCSKAAVKSSRMMLGNCGGGAVRLAPVAPEIAITEGIETGLSVQQATGIATWSALSAGCIKSLTIPTEVRRITIFADGDQVGIAAAEYAARRFHAEGRKVRITAAPAGRDFNDILCADNFSTLATLAGVVS